jgi:hypothetical protein
VRDNVSISHRGANYEIGRGPGFYGIWAAGSGVGTPRPQPYQWWPETPEGWSGAWARFTAIEAPGTIAGVGKSGAGKSGTGRSSVPVISPATRTILAVALLGVGVACGIAGLFPAYVGGSNLAGDATELVPHAIYLAVWAASALLIVSGGGRQRIGALLGIGTSIVTLGMFIADAGPVITDGTHIMGAGLVLSLLGWLGCAAGSAMAITLGSAGAPSRSGLGRGRSVLVPVVTILAGLGAAVAFAPAWDSYTLRTASGLTQTATLGNAFSAPGAVIAGNVIVMIAVAVVIITAATWRPVRLGAVLLAGAIIPLVAQAISAVIEVGETTSPLLFGISPAQAAQAGLTISNGVTAAFWIYCACLVVLALAGVWMLLRFRPVPVAASPDPAPAIAGPLPG